MAPSKTAPAYEKDEKILCFHGPLIYPAKVVDVEPVDPKDKKLGYRYLVHYTGWKSTWDDWVQEDRMRKDNEENRDLKKQLDAEQRRADAEVRAAKRPSTINSHKRRSTNLASDRDSLRPSEERSSSVAAPARGTKRGRDWEIEKQEEFMIRPSIRIPMPDHLKGLLVDDWENITKQLQLVPIPHVHPVTEILEAYREAEAPKRRPGSADADVLEEVIAGVKEYFDKSLGRILLYRFERQQWLEVHERMEAPAGGKSAGTKGKGRGAAPKDDEADLTGKAPSDIYGAEHLCRLFVSMPELIAQTNMDAQAVSRLREELAKMTSWLGKNAAKYFTKDYENAGQDYTAQARGTA